MTDIDDRDYRASMDGPMQDLAYVLFGLGYSGMTDPEIVAHSAKKIRILVKMLEAYGEPKQVLNVLLASP